MVQIRSDSVKKTRLIKKSNHNKHNAMNQIAKISYAQSTDPWLKRKVVNVVELATGRKKITDIYEQLKERTVSNPEIF